MRATFISSPLLEALISIEEIFNRIGALFSVQNYYIFTFRRRDGRSRIIFLRNPLQTRDLLSIPCHSYFKGPPEASPRKSSKSQQSFETW